MRWAVAGASRRPTVVQRMDGARPRARLPRDARTTGDVAGPQFSTEPVSPAADAHRCCRIPWCHVPFPRVGRRDLRTRHCSQPAALGCSGPPGIAHGSIGAAQSRQARRETTSRALTPTRPEVGSRRAQRPSATSCGRVRDPGIARAVLSRRHRHPHPFRCGVCIGAQRGVCACCIGSREPYGGIRAAAGPGAIPDAASAHRRDYAARGRAKTGSPASPLTYSSRCWASLAATSRGSTTVRWPAAAFGAWIRTPSCR